VIYVVGCTHMICVFGMYTCDLCVWMYTRDLWMQGDYIPCGPLRTSSIKRFNLQCDGFIACLERRVAAFAQVSLPFVEPLIVAKYEAGEYCNAHTYGPHRQKAMSVFLNDMKSGGETDFVKLGFQVKPQKGTALLWSNFEPDDQTVDQRLTHAALPPISEVKYVLECFVNVCEQQPAA